MLRFLCDITGLETGAGLTRVLAARGAGVGGGGVAGAAVLLVGLVHEVWRQARRHRHVLVLGAHL